MSDSSSHTPRRDFLARLAASAALVMAGSSRATSLAAATLPPHGARGRPAGAPEFDDSWAERVKGAKHRAVFDSPGVGDGAALDQVSVYLQNYHEMFGATDADTVPVIVMRHMGTVMAMGDALWEKYALGAREKLKDPRTGEGTKRNPFLDVGADDKFALIEAGSSLSALRARGVVLLACNRALMHFAAQTAQEHKADVEQVRAEFRDGLVPGVILLLAGIYAVTRAQEAGCTFLKSS